MLILDLISNFYEGIDLFDSSDAIRKSLESILDHTGLRYYALVHHIDNAGSEPGMVHIHNYPAEFATFHAEHHLGLRDPVHRACQRRGSGFLWEGLPILLSSSDPLDRRISERAQAAGIGDGYSIPYHVPGERSGSCSFAVETGHPFPRHLIPVMEALGKFAFEAARSLGQRAGPSWQTSASLSPRERDVVVLLGHGNPEKRIAQMLGISPHTVHDHVRKARAKFGVGKCTLLIVCALLSGAITYSEILRV